METFVCTHCGAVGRQEEAYWAEEEPLCQDCADAQTAICDRCGERYYLDNMVTDACQQVCTHCYDDYYTRCHHCGEIIPNSLACYMDDDEDYPYCSACYDDVGVSIHPYSYKPTPIFYGNAPRYFGVELEVDDGGKDSGKARQVLAVFNQNSDANPIGYGKADGSLEDGWELVTHPCTLSYHKENLPWEETLEKFKLLHYRSHNAGTCGLHVHVSRAAFGESEESQEAAIGHILYFFERFWQELLCFSRRTEGQIRQWAARYGYKDSGREILEHAKKADSGRYSCVNLLPRNTIEFRIFRGTLKYNTFLATLQLVDEICSVALSFGEEEMQSLSWPDFVARISAAEKPELVQYLKERRLYVNEPIAADCEV